MKPSSGPKRKAKLKPGRPPVRKTHMQRSGPPKKKTLVQLKEEGKDWPDHVREAALRRAGHQCEVGLEGCKVFMGLQLHHRKLRRHGDHRLENAIVACFWCHQISPHAIHSGEMVMVDGVLKLVAEHLGWFVRSYSDPALIPWLRRGSTFDPMT